MRTRTFFKTMLTSSIIVVILCSRVIMSVTGHISTKPHVIVIIADDMGWNDVSFHGSNQIPTPNIDALAYNGVILNNHYVLPVCTPSRTAFFTGRYPIRDGMYGFPLRAGEPRSIPLTTTLLPEHLRRLGYTTHMVGKWHVGYRADNFTPARRGFETFYGYYNGYITYYNYTIKQGTERGYDMHRDDQIELRPDRTSYKNKYATDMFTEEAVKVINKHDSHQPLYLQISHLAPHASDSEDTLETRDLAAVNKTFSYIKDIKRRKYAGMVSTLDESVGQVVSSLKKNGLLNNSIIIFMADNGAQTIGLHENHGSNYPLRGLKFTLFEGGVHGVACVYSPLIKRKGRIINDLFHITDWLPTLYSAAGGNVADLGEVDGVNQWPTIIRKKSGRRNALLVNIDDQANLESAIIHKYKIIKGASPIYDGYFGANVDDNDSSAPQYNLTAVVASETNQAIASMTNRSITSAKILRLRNQNKITCESTDNYSNCSVRCLFDLNNDPCETTDISNKHPQVVEDLEIFIDSYRGFLVEQDTSPVDPRSYPINFGGVWMPWLNSHSCS